MTLADVLTAGFEREYAPPPPPRDYKADFADDWRYLYRPLGARWNASTCRVGRPVTLSRGYGKHRRLSGVVAGFQEVGPEADPAIRRVYPIGDRFAAIRIALASKDAAPKAKGRPESLPNGARFSGPLPEGHEAYARSEGDGPAEASIAHAETDDNAGSAAE